MEQVFSKKHFLNNNLDIIINGCRQNSLQHQRQLYELCYPEMIKICRRYAKDNDEAGTIFNNAMLKVFKNIQRYTDEGKLTAWIKTIVVHSSIDFCKTKTRFNNTQFYKADNEISISPEVFDKVSGKEIQQLISQLPTATATVFNMFIYDGFTHRQIAAQLNISEGTSKWHVSEAKKNLKQKLSNFFTTEFKTNAAG